MDYSTNPIVSKFYSGGEPKAFRPGFEAEILKDGQDTITLGLDYYALNISSHLIPMELLQSIAPTLASGGVVLCRAVTDSNSIRFLSY